MRSVRRLDDLAKALGDFIEGGIPGYALELSAAFRSHASHRVQQPVVVVRPFHVPIHLRAEKPVGERMIGITRHANGPPVFHRHEHGARIRTIVRAGAFHDGFRHQRGGSRVCVGRGAYGKQAF